MNGDGPKKRQRVAKRQATKLASAREKDAALRHRNAKKVERQKERLGEDYVGTKKKIPRAVQGRSAVRNAVYTKTRAKGASDRIRRTSIKNKKK